MPRTKVTKRPPIVTSESPINDRKLSRSSSPSDDDCGIIAVVYAYIHTPNVQKKITMSAVYISEQSRSSSKWDFHFHSYVLTIYIRLY